MSWWVGGLVGWRISELMGWWVGELVDELMSWWVDELMSWWVDELVGWWVGELVNRWVIELMSYRSIVLSTSGTCVPNPILFDNNLQRLYALYHTRILPILHTSLFIPLHVLVNAAVYAMICPPRRIVARPFHGIMSASTSWMAIHFHLSLIYF